MKKVIKTNIAACLLILAISCKKENITTPSAVKTQSAEESVTTFHIGQHYGGGIIFYIDSTGQHGLIAAKEDQGYVGYGSDVIRTDARGRAIGQGYINTVKIINAYGTKDDYAALLCAKYRGGGYEGWFLPSLKELHELYLQKDVVGGFQTVPYWSSTEVSWDWAAAWIHYFNAEEETPSSKWNLYYVRPVRTF